MHLYIFCLCVEHIELRVQGECAGQSSREKTAAQRENSGYLKRDTFEYSTAYRSARASEETNWGQGKNHLKPLKRIRGKNNQYSYIAGNSAWFPEILMIYEPLYRIHREAPFLLMRILLDWVLLWSHLTNLKSYN